MKNILIFFALAVLITCKSTAQSNDPFNQISSEDDWSFPAKVANMWTPTSLWFEVAIVSIIYALGNILMGHFEEQTPKFRRVGKYLLTLVVVCLVSVYFGRAVSMTLLSLFIIPLLYVHGYYLPKKKGINGWTGEPKSKYYDFRKWNKDVFSKEKDDIIVVK